MARNQEKAQSMLNRFLAAKKDKLNKPRDKRPFLVEDVHTIGEAERWRIDLLREVSKKIAEIQNPALGEHRVRELNDEINKLLREKGHWERRIMELGGPDHTRTASVFGVDGKEIPGGAGYKYFGVARELPGVKELLEKHSGPAKKRSKFELLRGIDAGYYGYRDDEDGILLPLEAQAEREAVARADREWMRAHGIKDTSAAGAAAAGAADIDGGVGGDDADDVTGGYVAHVPLPNRAELERVLVERRKQELLSKYVSAALAAEDEETRTMLNRAQAASDAMQS